MSRSRSGSRPRPPRPRSCAVATERMVSAIEQITIHEGIDPRETVLVGGGGAAGLNVNAIARRLRCPEVIVPSVGPVLSAAGALISDLVRSFELTLRTTDREFAFEDVNRALDELERRCEAFIEGPGSGALSSDISFTVEARYPHQVWELEVPLPARRLAGPADLEALCESFHRKHRDVFAIADEGSKIEFESWHARARCRLGAPVAGTAAPRDSSVPPERRDIRLADGKQVQADVWHVDRMPIGDRLAGPAVVQTETTTVVVDAGSEFELLPSGTLRLYPEGGAQAGAPLHAHIAERS